MLLLRGLDSVCGWKNISTNKQKKLRIRSASPVATAQTALWDSHRVRIPCIVYTLSIQFQFCKIVEMKKMFKVQSSGKHIYFHYRADLGSLKDPENSIDDYKYGL